MRFSVVFERKLAVNRKFEQCERSETKKRMKKSR